MAALLRRAAFNWKLQNKPQSDERLKPKDDESTCLAYTGINLGPLLKSFFVFL